MDEQLLRAILKNLNEIWYVCEDHEVERGVGLCRATINIIEEKLESIKVKLETGNRGEE